MRKLLLQGQRAYSEGNIKTVHKLFRIICLLTVFLYDNMNKAYRDANINL